MKNEIENIDLIFRQKLSNSSLNVPKDEWKVLDKTLSFRNFLKFSLNHINIYYVSIFSAILFTAGAQFVQNHRLKNEIKKMEIIIRNNFDQKPVISIPAQHENNNLSIELKKGNQYSPIEKRNIIIQNSISKKPDNLIYDSTKITAEPVIQINDSVNSNKQKNIRVVKKTIYIKNNPVIIRDTVIKHKK
jgi:hypothetical protein